MKCEYCKSVEVNDSHKFCSQKCYHKSRVGKPLHSEEELSRRSERTKLQHKNRTEEQRLEINKKISEKNKFQYTEDHVRLLTEILDVGLTSSDSILAKKLGISKRVLYRIIEENNLSDKFHNRNKFIQKNIQNLTLDGQIEFLRWLRCKPWDEVSKKYNISKKCILYTCNLFNIKYIYKKPNRGESGPERIVREYLVELGVDFVQEKYLKVKLFRADFVIDGNKVIEVNGDYFHANPEIYSHKILTPMQISNLKRDKLKLKFYKEHGFEVLIIWESDLKSNLEGEKEKIKDYVYGK